MEPSKLLLLAELPGLEAARQWIDARILEIQQQLSVGGATYEKPPAILDPNILGRDVLGRIKRKRKLSPWALQQKRELIAAARQKRLDKLKVAAEGTGAAKTEAPQKPAPPPVAASAPQLVHKKK